CTLNLRQVCCNHNEIDIHCVNGLNVAIHRQAADQTPWLISVQHGYEVSEIARAPICYRFVDFSRSHSRLIRDADNPACVANVRRQDCPRHSALSTCRAAQSSEIKSLCVHQWMLAQT